MRKHTCETQLAALQTCNVQNLIKTLRKASKMTQVELATRLNVTQQEISKLEQPGANITLDKLSSICTELQIFPVITFSQNHITIILDTQFIKRLNQFMELSPEKQTLIYELIRLLS